MYEEKIKELLGNILTNIDEVGWHVTGVFADPKKNTPPFCYSVGLFSSYEHPELIVFGLPHETAHLLINAIGEKIKKGQGFIPGEKYDIDFSFPLCLSRINKKYYADYLSHANWYYEDGGSFSCLQILWPDKEGVYPYEDGFDPKFIPYQPQLWKD